MLSNGNQRAAVSTETCRPCMLLGEMFSQRWTVFPGMTFKQPTGFRLAATNNDTDSQLELGKLYQNAIDEEGVGLTRDQHEAEKMVPPKQRNPVIPKDVYRLAMLLMNGNSQIVGPLPQWFLKP